MIEEENRTSKNVFYMQVCLLSTTSKTTKMQWTPSRSSTLLRLSKSARDGSVKRSSTCKPAERYYSNLTKTEGSTSDDFVKMLFQSE